MTVGAWNLPATLEERRHYNTDGDDNPDETVDVIDGDGETVCYASAWHRFTAREVAEIIAQALEEAAAR